VLTARIPIIFEMVLILLVLAVVIAAHFCPHGRQAFYSLYGVLTLNGFPQKLVEYSETSGGGVQLAQVDCSVNGGVYLGWPRIEHCYSLNATDLCDANKVKGYPQLNLYRDGEFVEKYKANRDYDLLTKYIDKHAPPPKAPSPPSPPAAPPVHAPAVNSKGEVTVLDPDNFHAHLEQGPAFIKFYAPWCGHCRKLKVRRNFSQISPLHAVLIVSASSPRGNSSRKSCKGRSPSRR
jgi:thiol-disulfide isomerase/thioredoxin